MRGTSWPLAVTPRPPNQEGLAGRSLHLRSPTNKNKVITPPTGGRGVRVKALAVFNFALFF